MENYGLNMQYDFVLDSSYRYQRKIKMKIADGFELNQVYEAKAFEYFQKHKDELQIKSTDQILFWCIGNNNFIY